MPQPNSLLLATADQLARFAPFDSMEQEQRIWLAERLKLTYYDKGEVILGPDSGPVATFYIIRQGVIHGEQGVVNAGGDASWLELHEGECFPLGALLSRRAVASIYRAGQDTFCFELASADFHELLKRSDAFHDFCTRRLANLLEQSKQVIQAEFTNSSSEHLSSTLASLIRRQPVSCAPETPLRRVLETMHTLGIGSMIAVDQENMPLGIFTLHDLLQRVVLADTSLDAPFHAVMSPNPETLPPHALAQDAALLMARRGYRHILVAEHGRLLGLVSERDLFSLQRVGLRQISGAIRHAEHLDQLKEYASDIRQLGHNLLAQGVAAEQITQIIATLGDLLTKRIIQLELRGDPAENLTFCWLALGADGRMEQTLDGVRNDAIVFAASNDVDATRAVLLPFARRVNLALAQCGLAAQKFTASAPEWCLSLPEWQHTCADWISQEHDLESAEIFLDFRPLAGAEHLATALRAWLIKESNPQFLRRLAAHALRKQPASVWDYIADHSLDVELHGLAFFVDAARILGLAAGCLDTHSLERLNAGSAALRIPPQDAQAWGEAFRFIQLLLLRLKFQNEAPTMTPDALSSLDRRILKEAHRQARKLRARLAVEFQG